MTHPALWAGFFCAFAKGFQSAYSIIDVGYEMWDVKEDVLISHLKSHISHQQG